MGRKDLLKCMHVIRRDLGNLVVHWTRTQSEFSDDFEEKHTSAFKVLSTILKGGRAAGIIWVY